MTATPRVVVVGDALLDVVVRACGPPAAGTDTAATTRLRGGGAAANAAVWFVRAGAEAHLVARVGDDAAGRVLADELAAAGVVAHLVADARTSTGTVVVLVDRDGERSFLTDRGAADRLAVGDVPPSLLEAGTHLHLSGYALHGAGSRAAARAALGAAVAAGASTSVDPASAAPLSAVGGPVFLGWIRGAGWCTPNREEAAVLVGEPEPHAAARALAAWTREAVVTCAADGAVWSDGASTAHVPAVPAEVVDTTGAGDAFAAGFLVARLGGASPEEALHAGAALAAEAVGRTGGR